MILDARPYVKEKIEELKIRVEKLDKKPCLVIVRVGNDPASEKYINNKVKKCEEVGIKSKIIHLEEDVDELDVTRTIMSLNWDEDVTAILLQLPLPKHLNEYLFTNFIFSSKDVDGFTTDNLGKLMIGQEGNIACTPRGIISLLKYYDIPMEGKDVLIINRSNIVGKPLAHLFLQENATVTIAHSKTKNLEDKIKQADIVVTGIGKAKAWNFTNFSNWKTIVDVSINFDENGKMCGDVNKEDYDFLVDAKACNITPVPNGVGQMTVIELIEQTIEIAERNKNKKE